MAFYTLLSQLTCLNDSIKMDVMRRLRGVSKVNAYALDMLDSALFTVVYEADGTNALCTEDLMQNGRTNSSLIDSNNDNSQCAYQSQ